MACYSLKLEGEPEYDQSSGCMLTVDESYPHLLAGKSHNIEDIYQADHRTMNRNAGIADDHATHCYTQSMSSSMWTHA